MFPQGCSYSSTDEACALQNFINVDAVRILIGGIAQPRSGSETFVFTVNAQKAHLF